MSDEQTPRPAKETPTKPPAPDVKSEPDATVIVRGRVSHVEAKGDQPPPLKVPPQR